MKTGWLVVSKERHIDDSYTVCLDKNLAIEVAKKITQKWIDVYSTDGRDGRDVDTKAYGHLIYSYAMEGCFSVTIEEISILENAGEAAAVEKI